MAEVLLFHHALGLTEGVKAFATTLRAAGHVVHTPDLFDGRRFEDVQAGVAHAKSIGFGVLLQRGVQAAQALPQTRPGARGALLLHACVPVDSFSPRWPDGVPVQIHAMEADPFFVDDGDIEAALALTKAVPQAELVLYPGRQHLFAEVGQPSYDAAATAAMTARVLAFLALR
jgi:dienelactone hydrolase